MKIKCFDNSWKLNLVKLKDNLYSFSDLFIVNNVGFICGSIKLFNYLFMSQFLSKLLCRLLIFNFQKSYFTLLSYKMTVCLFFQEIRTLVEEIEAKIQETMETEGDAQDVVRKAQCAVAPTSKNMPSGVKSKGEIATISQVKFYIGRLILGKIW